VSRNRSAPNQGPAATRPGYGSTSQRHWGWQEMNSNSRTAVSAELGLRLVGPEHTIVPLMASLQS